MLKAIDAAMARAHAAMKRIALVPVIEAAASSGARSRLWRPTTPSPKPRPRSRRRPPSPPRRRRRRSTRCRSRSSGGMAAAEHLYPSVDSEIPPGILDRAAAAYLDGLSPKERASLIAHEPRYIGEHLLGERCPAGPAQADEPVRVSPPWEGQRCRCRRQAARAEMEKSALTGLFLTTSSTKGRRPSRPDRTYRNDETRRGHPRGGFFVAWNDDFRRLTCLAVVDTCSPHTFSHITACDGISPEGGPASLDQGLLPLPGEPPRCGRRRWALAPCTANWAAITRR